MEEKKTRYSHQRELIYNYIKSVHTHPSAEDIYQALKHDNPNLSLGTVYRNIAQLMDTGKIARVDASSATDHYECADCGEHAHFICSCCGKIYDLNAITNEEIAEMFNLDKQFITKDITVTFRGICPACSENIQ